MGKERKIRCEISRGNDRSGSVLLFLWILMAEVPLLNADFFTLLPLPRLGEDGRLM